MSCASWRILDINHIMVRMNTIRYILDMVRKDLAMHRNCRSLGIVLFLSLSGLFGFARCGLAADEPATELYVRTVPEGAKVSINGKEVGVTPGLFRADPGTAKIAVRLDGHDPIDKEVEIQASRITRVELDFNKAASVAAGTETIKTITPADAPISSFAGWEKDELVVRSERVDTIHLFEVPVSDRDQCMIIYRFRIKTEESTSSVYPEMWCCSPGQGEAFSRGLDQKLRGANNWTSIQIPFYLRKGETPDLLKLNMVFEGTGTVRMKDIQVLAAPLPPSFSSAGPQSAKDEQKADVFQPEKTEAGNILKNSGMKAGKDSPDNWTKGAKIDGVKYSWDKKVASEGKASLSIEKTAKGYFPIAQWSQTVKREGDKPVLVVSAQVKTKNMYKAVLDVVFLDAQDNWISHEWIAYIGAKEDGDPPANHDWKKYSGKVEIPANSAKICIGLQDYGPGKVWFDDVKASYTDAK